MKPNDPDDLLEQLRGKEPEKLASRVGEVDKLGPQDYEDRKRATDFHIQRHWKIDVGRWKNWVIFTLVASFSAFLVICAMTIIGHYLLQIKDDTEAIGSLIGYIFELILVAFTALFVEDILQKNKQ